MTTATLKSRTDAQFARKRLFAFGLPALVLAYFVYIFFAFDVPGLAERARLDNAATLVADSYSYKTHVTRQNRGTEAFSVSIEGERKGDYPEGVTPDWVTVDGDQIDVDLTEGYAVRWDGPTVLFEIPDYGVIEATPGTRGVDLTLPGPQPEWINASRNRVTVTTPNGRLTITRNQTEVFRYFLGWELFFFTLDSPYYNQPWGTLLFGEQIDPERGNLSGMWEDFWSNKMWRHGDVAWALFETILMAFLGTMGAGLLALPLAFLSARNFMSLVPVRFGIRRLFDFVRGVDGLIWTIILSRAFGPGPLTGTLAILITDTGTLGKLFSEALENVDDKQIEGVKSTGANALQRNRFGVLPQITPVFISQLLYYLESNTRSATIIGAIVGGGIGLLLTQAIITQKDWEEVTYYILLIVLMVMAMDTASGWLRQKLIGKSD
ncbi:MAG: phosphonate ABC transporter, permease protein PhnE [Pseudomonadota bacterium]